MEECVNLGLAKSIGVSNFNSEQIDRLYAAAKIKPVCNQIEVNPNINQKKLIEFCKERNIVVTGYCPLGRSEYAGTPGFPHPTIFDSHVAEIGKKYNKTPAQVVLNYLVKYFFIHRFITDLLGKKNIQHLWLIVTFNN